MKFTKTEISLCKEIAEKYKKQSRHLNHYFKYGNWYEYMNNSYLITSQPQSEMSPEITILWTIFDCLGFLKKEINSFKLKFARGKFKFHYWKSWTKPVCYYGKTPLEVCLKAILAVLEEERGEMNLSEIEKCLISNALKMGEFKDWIEDNKTPHKTKRIYKKLIEKFENSLKKGLE